MFSLIVSQKKSSEIEYKQNFYIFFLSLRGVEISEQSRIKSLDERENELEEEIDAFSSENKEKKN